MGFNYLANPVIFVIDSLASLYILALMMRFLLQWCSAPYYNPISQFLVKITHPPLRFLRRFVPPIGKIDSSSLLLIFVLQVLANFLILKLQGIAIGAGTLAVLSFADLVSLFINVFVFAVFARALLSWVGPGAFDAATAILISLTEPLLSVARKMIPDLAGLDLSPLLVLLFLQLAKMVVLPPLQQLASLLS